MDFFKFKSATSPTQLEQGEKINDLASAMWVERYAQPGEFSFEAPLSTGLREFLPLGTLISHVDTLDIMIVETHEIVESKTSDPTLVVSGRSFVSYLENRVVGMDLVRMGDRTVTPYVLSANYIPNQIVKLIEDHIHIMDSGSDVLPNVACYTTLPGTGVSVERPINFGDIWERVAELLPLSDLGIKTQRKNTFGLGYPGYTTFLIHKGVDRSSSVFFSWKSGELDSASYLFTNKNDKNAAMVLGQYVYTVVDLPGFTGYNRRTMLVDATDIDGHLGATPSGTALTDVVNAMTVRGQQALLGQNTLTISQTDISPNTQYRYRRDYDIGDLISLDGNFGQIAVMRVVEYAEIEDENGESGHPTLALPGA